MSKNLFELIDGLHGKQGGYGKITCESYREGDAREIISIEGNHLVAVFIRWFTGDLSFDLLSTKSNGSMMQKTRYFEPDHQNEANIAGFLDDFKRLDLA